MESKKILYVEDDDTLAFIISKKMEHLGHKIIICKNGKDAIEKLTFPNDFDLIISDNILPCISGIEILKHVREKLNSEIPFILISLDSSLYLKEIFYKFNGTKFLKKPFNFDTLIKIIQNPN